MVGDTPFDARAATGCGVKAIGVLTGCTAVLPSLRPFSLGPTGQPTRLLSVQAVADLLARRFAAGTLRQIPRWP
jgi:phosphoglycolate phosphatase-like HAD superfamily hydrolase